MVTALSKMYFALLGSEAPETKPDQGDNIPRLGDYLVDYTTVAHAEISATDATEEALVAQSKVISAKREL